MLTINNNGIVLDERAKIGPHYLAIGKTRKILVFRRHAFAFFSVGHQICCATIDTTRNILVRKTLLNFSTGWGGGSFCVDDDNNGGVLLVFIHKNQHELCFCRGVVDNDNIQFSAASTILFTKSTQAAPYVEVGIDGTSWVSVLDRDGDFKIAVITKCNKVRTASLFEETEEPWYHSCVQMLPIDATHALAVGFCGKFPDNTNLIAKTVDIECNCSATQYIANCNVNDKLTFHFQAVGDPSRNAAHIVYLDKGLHVSHAQYSLGTWEIRKDIIQSACFAPQIAVNQDGALALLAYSYEGTVWSSTWSQGIGWREAYPLENALSPNVSALFGQTGYGTGGSICCARSTSGEIFSLCSNFVDDYSGTSRLTYWSYPIIPICLDKKSPLCIVSDQNNIDITILLESFVERIVDDYFLINIIVPILDGEHLKFSYSTNDHVERLVVELYSKTGYKEIAPEFKTQFVFSDCFSANAPTPSIKLSVAIDLRKKKLIPNSAWAELYFTDLEHTTVDIAPYKEETNACLSKCPTKIPTTFIRAL